MFSITTLLVLPTVKEQQSKLYSFFGLLCVILEQWTPKGTSMPPMSVLAPLERILQTTPVSFNLFL